LEAGGLASALEELATQVRSQHRIACRFEEGATIPDLEETLATNLFRIAQEAVNNAIKHGKASQINLALSADPQQILLAIEDNGAGFQPKLAPGRGMGLHIMNYRARMVGAAFNMEPRAGGGTTVTCSVRRSNLTKQSAYANVERE
jgi:two-component system CheB/CheR fusion protein